jgi:endonuclease G
MFEVPAQGLQDGAAPLRVLTPPDAGAQPETPAMLRQEQQAAAAERARCYSDALADQLRARRIFATEIDERRLRFVRPEDGLGAERILGRSDLVPINWLEFGQRAARTVCHLQVRQPNGAIAGHATGFLVAPGLLLTNNHVLPDAQMAARSLAEFDCEDDAAFEPRPSKLFRLRPEELFFTSRSLDFSFVALAPAASDGTSLSIYGYLRLADEPDQLQEGEFVSIIQHPSGNTKQAALRENRVIWSDANFIHYQTDTGPASSGAPVFNDQWYVVALHHSGVARSNAGSSGVRQGEHKPPLLDSDDADIKWMANEGVRVSRIFRALAESGDSAAQHVLTRLRATAGGPDTSPIFVPTSDATAAFSLRNAAATAGARSTGLLDYVPAPTTGGRASFRQERRVITPPAADALLYAERGGYREDFLGDGARLRVSLPRIAEGNQLLRYTNFSIIFDLEHRLARMTAVNIDGRTWQHIDRRRPDTWSYDPRVAVDAQVGRNLYDGTRYDFGHLVRRHDACSGRDAALAGQDPSHLTRAAPQERRLNVGPWNHLENHVLDTIRMIHSRVTVLSGPVHRDDDPLDRGIRIPQDFFKIAAYVDGDGNLAAAGWVQRQPASKNPAPERVPGFLGRFLMWQVPIARIGELTGLDLSPLLAADALGRRRRVELASDLQAVPIASSDDILLCAFRFVLAVPFR